MFIKEEKNESLQEELFKQIFLTNKSVYLLAVNIHEARCVLIRKYLTQIKITKRRIKNRTKTIQLLTNAWHSSRNNHKLTLCKNYETL